MQYIQIVYATKTKHSKLLAQSIGKALGVEAKRIDAYIMDGKTELLFIVGGIYGGKCNPLLVSFARTLDASQVRKVVLVTSSTSISQRNQREVREILTANGIEVIDEITCPGRMLFVKITHPSKQDVHCIASAAINIARNAIQA